MTTQGSHLEVEVEQYPRGKTLSLPSCFPEKCGKPSVVTESQDNETLLNE